MSFINKILRDWSELVSDGQPIAKNKKHVTILTDILREQNYPETFINEFVDNLLTEKGKQEDASLAPKEKEKAKKLKLVPKGPGYWGPEDSKKATHKVEKGKLVAIEPEKETDDSSDVSNLFKDDEYGGLTPAEYEKQTTAAEKETNKNAQSVINQLEKPAGDSNADTKEMSDFRTRSKNMKNQTPERQQLLDKNLSVIQTVLDPNKSDIEKLEALDTISWSFSQGDPPRKFYLKDLYDNGNDRSDKILGKSAATEKLVQTAVDLLKRNNKDLPTELSSRQMGDIGKIEATQVDPTVLSVNNAHKDDFTKSIETNAGLFGEENADGIREVVSVMRDLGHTESVYVDVNDYVNDPDKFQREMGAVTVQILKDSRNSMVKRFGKQFKPDTIKYLDTKIAEMEQKYKNGEVTQEYLGQFYADLKAKMGEDNQQASEAFANNMGEMFAIQDETLRGHYVVIPTAKNAKLGDKVRVMTRDGVGKPSQIKVLTDLMGSVKKSAATTVGAQHTHVGIIEGCEFGDEETKLKIMTSAHAAKYMFDEDGEFNKTNFIAFLKGSKDLKDLKEVEQLLLKMGLDPALMNSDEGRKKLTDDWEAGLKDKDFKNKLSKQLLLDAGLNSPKVKNDAKKLQNYLKENNITMDEYLDIMVGNAEAANGKTIRNAMKAILTGNTDGLDTKELQIACSLIAMPQKTKENFGYDVVDASDGPWSITENYGQVNGETIHQENGSYIMGYLTGYDMNPRYGKDRKAYNIGKRSLVAIEKKKQKLQVLIDQRKGNM